MAASTIFAKFRSYIDDEDSRWWRTNVLSFFTLLFCVALTYRAIRAGNSWFCLALPITYAGLWQSLRKCRGILKSITLEGNTPFISKLSSEIHSLAFSINLCIVLFGIFFFLRLSPFGQP
jgi:hypothetical protein